MYIGVLPDNMLTSALHVRRIAGVFSVVVLEESPYLRRSSKTNLQVLVLVPEDKFTSPSHCPCP